jgi:hypothetical protein
VFGFGIRRDRLDLPLCFRDGLDPFLVWLGVRFIPCFLFNWSAGLRGPTHHPLNLFFFLALFSLPSDASVQGRRLSSRRASSAPVSLRPRRGRSPMLLPCAHVASIATTSHSHRCRCRPSRCSDTSAPPTRPRDHCRCSSDQLPLLHAPSRGHQNWVALVSLIQRDMVNLHLGRIFPMWDNPSPVVCEVWTKHTRNWVQPVPTHSNLPTKHTLSSLYLAREWCKLISGRRHVYRLVEKDICDDFVNFEIFWLGFYGLCVYMSISVYTKICKNKKHKMGIKYDIRWNYVIP